MKLLQKILFKASANKSLISNFSYISILQLFNLILPLITYPYLIRTLGKDNYGLIVFAQAFVGYLLILVGYGFNVSATKDVSVYRDNREMLTEIVSSVLIIKGVLFALSLLFLTVLLEFLPQASSNHLLFYLTLWVCLYEFIFPVWYFQGIERMKYITYLTLLSRMFFLSMIFVFIKNENDYLLMPIINGIGAIVAGLISLYIIFYKHQIKFKWQPTRILFRYIKNSTPIFLSNLSIRLYVSTNKVIIGMFLSMGEVAYYDLAEKIVSILKLPQTIISQTLFPKISKDRNINFIKKAFKYSIILNIVILIITLILSDYFISFLGGSELGPAVVILNILIISVPIIAMSNIFGVQILIPFGKVKFYSFIVILSGFIYLFELLLIWLFWDINLYSLSLVSVLTELFVTIIMFYYCKKFQLW